MYGYWYCYSCEGYHKDDAHITKDYTIFRGDV
jgi:hypothetical protein